MPNQHKQPLLQQAYLPLLIFSVATAAFFCFLYLTSQNDKPTNNQPQSIAQQQGNTDSHSNSSNTTPPDLPAEQALSSDGPLSDNFLPSQDGLPSRIIDGNTSTPQATQPTTPPRPSQSRYEPTNLSLQHVVVADLGNGQLQKIVIDAPVLYESRLLRLNASQQTEAQNLFDQMVMLMEQSRHLQRETEETLIAWEMLVRSTSPGRILRADSPTLPRQPIDPPLTPPSDSALQSESSSTP